MLFFHTCTTLTSVQSLPYSNPGTHVTHVIFKITPFGVNEPEEMEQENDAIHYSIEPELKKSGRKWLYTYDIL